MVGFKIKNQSYTLRCNKSITLTSQNMHGTMFFYEHTDKLVAYRKIVADVINIFTSEMLSLCCL